MRLEEPSGRDSNGHLEGRLQLFQAVITKTRQTMINRNYFLILLRIYLSKQTSLY